VLKLYKSVSLAFHRQHPFLIKGSREGLTVLNRELFQVNAEKMVSVSLPEFKNRPRDGLYHP